MISPSAVTHGSCRHEPTVPPQSASEVQVPKRFANAFVVQRISPLVPFSRYEPGIGWPGTIGAHVGAPPGGGSGHGSVDVVVVDAVVVVVGHDSPDARGLQTSVSV